MKKYFVILLSTTANLIDESVLIFVRRHIYQKKIDLRDSYTKNFNVTRFENFVN